MSHHVGKNGSYTFTDYDGESLTFKQEEDSVEGKYLTIAYSGQGPVIPSGIDSVARMALAMLERSSENPGAGMASAIRQLRRAIEIHELGRRFKLNEEVEVFDRLCQRNEWIRGKVEEYDPDGYSVLPRDSGVAMYYREEDVREVSNA